MGEVINKLYGIYHADGGLVGELAYIFGKYTGNVHCSLCDICLLYTSDAADE